MKTSSQTIHIRPTLAVLNPQVIKTYEVTRKDVKKLRRCKIHASTALA